MDQINEQKPELLERELVGVMQATFEFFTGAAKAFSGLEAVRQMSQAFGSGTKGLLGLTLQPVAQVLKESRERPAMARSYPEDGAARPGGFYRWW